MNCPICRAEMLSGLERTGDSWFSGTYCCLRHGVLRVMGRIFPDGRTEPVAWLPRCLEHGFEPVIQVDQEYRCTECDTRIYLIGGSIRRARPITLINGRPALHIV